MIGTLYYLENNHATGFSNRHAPVKSFHCTRYKTSNRNGFNVQRGLGLRNLPKLEKVTRASAINSVTKITSRYRFTGMNGCSYLGTSAKLVWNLPLSKS
jgi:hypothetical protein